MTVIPLDLTGSADIPVDGDRDSLDVWIPVLPSAPKPADRSVSGPS